jgi:hypothetical protein
VFSLMAGCVVYVDSTLDECCYPQTKFSMLCHEESHTTVENRDFTLLYFHYFIYFISIPLCHTEFPSGEIQWQQKST